MVRSSREPGAAGSAFGFGTIQRFFPRHAITHKKRPRTPPSRTAPTSLPGVKNGSRTSSASIPTGWCSSTSSEAQGGHPPAWPAATGAAGAWKRVQALVGEVGPRKRPRARPSLPPLPRVRAVPIQAFARKSPTCCQNCCCRLNPRDLPKQRQTHPEKIMRGAQRVS